MEILIVSERSSKRVTLLEDGNGDLWVMCEENGFEPRMHKVPDRSPFDNARDACSDEQFEDMLHQTCNNPLFNK